MFRGEEFVRLRSDLPRSKLLEIVEDSFRRVGEVDFFSHGEFEVDAKRYRSFATVAKVAGRLSKGRKEGEWELTVTYEAVPSPTCWIIFCVGLLFALIGMLILIVPYQAKSEIQRGVIAAVRDTQRRVSKAVAKAPKEKPTTKVPRLSKVVDYTPEVDGGVG